MLYQLEQEPVERKIIEQCLRENRPFPSKIADAPELRMGLIFIYEAFQELTSCRFLGMAEGPIPWTAVNTYCDVYGVDFDHKQDFFYLIRALDNTYLRFQSQRQQKRLALSKSKSAIKKGKK